MSNEDSILNALKLLDSQESPKLNRRLGYTDLKGKSVIIDIGKAPTKEQRDNMPSWVKGIL